MQIIIPAAKIVPENLQRLGKLPSVIYPVNDKPVFDYLYQEYSGDRFRVVVYENGESVHRQLAKYGNTKIIDLAELKDLGHTIYAGIEDTKGEAIINYGDTIVDEDIRKKDGNVIYYAEDHLSGTWTFFDQKEGRITDIIDKENVDSDRLGMLFVGVFRFSHIEYLRECLEKAFSTKDSKVGNFYIALKLYSEKYPFAFVKTDKWFDIGHSDKYFSSQLEVKARQFNHIRIDKNRGILTKSSDDVDKFIGEIKWYLKLPADLEYVRPRIFSYSTSYTDPYVSMEYYAYHTVHELFLYADLSRSQWRNIFERIHFVCHDFRNYTVKNDRIVPSLEDMYLNKTLQRLAKLKKDERFSGFFTSPITVNGVKYKSLNDIAELLKSLVPSMLYDVDTFNIIHGDLCFANIMIDSNYNFIKVIDPRGKFGDFDIYGDPRYELAKLFHSVDGKYDYIIKDLFEADYDLKDARVDYHINDRQRDFDIYGLFTEVFRDEIGGDLKKIELIESLLFLSMIPLHGESLKHQMAMLGTGIEILSRVADIKE